MANLLARFRRGRTKSLSGPSALTSPSLTLPTPSTAPSTQPAVPQSSPIERKIHPDLDSLVANWTPPVQPVRDPPSTSAAPAPVSPSPFPTALRPSTRRHSIDGANPVLRPSQTDPHLDDLPEFSVPIPFATQPLPPTRARRLITRLTGTSSPPSSSANLATTSAGVGWSTFGRRGNKKGGDTSRPHLSDFGELGRGSPAPSQGTSLSRSVSQSRSPSQVNLGTPSTTSQQLDDSVTYSNSGHEHPMTPGSDLASPSSGFTFGSQGRVGGRASTPASTSASPPPPMPPLDHPAFRGTARGAQSASQSQTPSQVQLPRLLRAGHPRSSSSLPSMSTSRRKRIRGGTGDRTKAQDIFASLKRPGSARRRASVEFGSSQMAPDSREAVFLALGVGGEREKEGKREHTPSRTNSQDQFGPNSRYLRGGDGDSKFDARAKRVGGSSDTQVGDPFVWPDNPLHSTESSSSTMDQKKAATPLLMPPSFSSTAATPEGSPAGPPRVRSTSEGPSVILRPPTPARSQSDGNTRGKRKVDDVERGSTPPKAPGTLDPRPIHPSHSTASSHAPSSFHRQKRTKLATAPDPPPRPASRSGSVSAANTASASSRGSAAQPHSGQPSRAPSRMSQASVPISALVAPRAPSVARSAGGTPYLMSDPRKPPRIQPTGWGLVFEDDRWWGGGPVHAWLFFMGFVLFPLWWVAGFCVPVPRTRRIDADAEEKGREQVVLDDPQVEFDAKSWRKRCRIMAGISLVTYVPFIVLLAVFLSRR